MVMFLRSIILVPAGMAMLFLLQIVIARSVSPEGFGLINYVFSVVSIIAVIASAGLPVSAPKFLPIYEVNKDYCLRAGYLKFSFIWIAGIGVGISTVLMILYLFKNEAVYIYSSMVVLPMMFWIWQRYISLGLDKVSLAIVPREIIYPIISIFIIYQFEISSIFTMFLVLCLAYLSSILLAMYKLWHILSLCEPCRYVSRYSIKEWLKVSIPMMFSSLMTLGYNNWDILILGLFVSFEDLGKYSAAVKLALGVSIAVRIVNVAIAQKISKANASTDVTNMKRIVKSAFLLSTVFSITIGVIMIHYSEELLGLLGEGYIDAYRILWILIIGQLVSGVFGPSMSILNIIGYESVVMIDLFKWSLLSLIFYLIVIPMYGVYGAAIITTFTLIMVRSEQFYKLISHFRNIAEAT